MRMQVGKSTRIPDHTKQHAVFVTLEDPYHYKKWKRYGPEFSVGFVLTPGEARKLAHRILRELGE